MSFLAAIPIIGKVVEKVVGVIDDLVPDKDLAAKLKAQVQMSVMSMDHAEIMETIKAQKDIIVAEAKSDSWLTRSWRPIVMLGFMAILFMTWFGYKPDYITDAVLSKVFQLLQIGIGGYVVGRSVEKAAGPVANIFKKKT